MLGCRMYHTLFPFLAFIELNMSWDDSTCKSEVLLEKSPEWHKRLYDTTIFSVVLLHTGGLLEHINVENQAY